MVVLTAFSANAQKNIIKWNELAVSLKTINLAYERVLTDKLSAQLQGFYWLGGSVGDVKFSGFGITPEVRFYPKGEGAKGFFLAPFFRYTNYSIKFDTYDISMVPIEGKGTWSAMGAGLCIGGQWIVADHFSIDLYAGPGYNFVGKLSYADSYSGSMPSIKFDGLMFRLGTTIGYAF